MRVLRLDEEAVTERLTGRALAPLASGACALTLGSFDGLHRGHQALVETLRAARDRLGLPVAALFTFRRHPRALLDPERAPQLLTPWRERLALLREAGLDLVVAADFCPALARTPYDEFVRLFLRDALGMRHFVAGHDVHLGAGRGGNAATLAVLGERLGYGFETVPAYAVAGATVSSSAIRERLAAGDLAAANGLLGRPYALWGEVGPGDGRGRGLGWPTANVTPLEAQKLLPAPGVYAVSVLVPDDVAATGAGWTAAPADTAMLPPADAAGDLAAWAPRRWRRVAGMLNYGRAPTFHAGGLERPRVEVHLLDFAGDLRGRVLRVDWIARLRDERRFGGVPELTAQLERDRAAARRALGG